MAENANPNANAEVTATPSRRLTGRGGGERRGGGGAGGEASLQRSTSNKTFSLQRKRSYGDRIDNILETAHQRAGTMGAGTASPRSPRAPSSPVLASQPSTSQTITEDSSADERTGFMSSQDPNYSGFNTSNGPRSRKQGRRSRPASQSEARQPPVQDGMDATRQNGEGEDEDGKKAWWESQLERFQSVELENKGSVARDHLAIERTFLAWLRTSLAFASIGIAVTQLFRLNTSLLKDGQGGAGNHTLRHMGKPLGATFLGISILILFLGYRRYFISQEWVMKGKFPASRGTIMIVAFVAFAIMVASLVVVIAIQPSESEV